MNFYIDNRKINSIKIYQTDAPSVQSAAAYLYQYAEFLGLKICDDSDLNVHLILDPTLGDGFSIKLAQDELVLRGGKRGIIYSVFSFLEIVGCRFFTPTLETLPKGDVFLSAFEKKEYSPFEFRDILCNCTRNRAWSLKQKINSDLWSSRKFTEADGGGYNYAGIPAHSLTGEYLLQPFVESNPEYFSIVDGVRHIMHDGQICMTNEEAIKAAASEACRILRENPDRNIISVSQGDNNNFCQCDSCKRAVEEHGLVHVYFGMINKIARIIKKEFPHVLVHTLAYESLCKKIDFKLEDNIMLQYCFGECNTHAIDDESCAVNENTRAQLIDICRKCDNVHVWNYVNCFKYELFEYPFIHNFRRNMKFFADVGVKGVFNEAFHRSSEETDFANTMELRSYILAKLMWNPCMTEEEFKNHIMEFCQAFYGKGAEYIVRYLDLYEKMSGECATYDRFVIPKSGDKTADVVALDKISEFIALAKDFLNMALELAVGDQIHHIKKLQTTILYLELYYTMDDVLQNGSDKDKQIVLEMNSKLIDDIIRNKFVITFWGQSRKTQNEELDTKRDISPVHWNYRWN